MNKEKILKFVKENKMFLGIFALFVTLIILVESFPTFTAVLIIVVFVIWEISKRSAVGSAENTILVNYDEIYENLHEILLEAVQELFQISGHASETPKKLYVGVNNRYVTKYEENKIIIFYRYAFIIPENFELDNYDIQKQINQKLKDNCMIGEWIPVVYQIVRRGRKIGLVLTTCYDERTYYEELKRIEATYYTSDERSKKDDDF